MIVLQIFIASLLGVVLVSLTTILVIHHRTNR